jgi:serine/threonine-protein kinase
MIEPARREQIERLYHAALEREEASRTGFLDEACAGDTELRREVEGLLAGDDLEENYIEGRSVFSQ